uniref:KAP NTPase domain-containing protein n=1 Tax=Hucho hucho TaxID=62062 RepID=A0A4W5QBP1_9TELE
MGVPAAAAIRFIFQMGKNLIFNQDLNVRKALDNERVSDQLGFMNEVRKEMWLLSRFILFMEVFEQRRIRVVLEITNLDRCAPKKIVGILDAISILLSDEESPFISLLAVNPEVLVQQVHVVLPVNPEVLVQQVHIDILYYQSTLRSWFNRYILYYQSTLRSWFNRYILYYQSTLRSWFNRYMLHYQSTLRSWFNRYMLYYQSTLRSWFNRYMLYYQSTLRSWFNRY